MKRFFQIALIFSILVSIAGSLAGCGNAETTSSNTIKFWHFWSEPHQKQAIQALIEQFEKENDCKVELTELSWNDGKTKLIAAFNSGVGPDVLELGSDWIAQFSAINVLSPINEDSADLGKFLEYSLPPAKWEDKYYAVPWIVDTRVMFYNKALMQRAGLDTLPPKTYSELIDYSNKINNVDNDNIYGFGTNGSDPHRLYKKILPMFWTYGGDILDDNGNPIINSPSNMSALTTYQQLSRLGIIETQRQLDAIFAKGNIGFVFSGAWLMEKIKNENPTLDYGVALMPNVELTTTTSKRPGISFLGCEFLSINAKTDKKDLSMKLIKFLTDGKQALTLSKQFAEAGFPADKQYFEDPYFKQNHNKYVFAQQLAYSKSTPVYPKWLDVEQAIEDAVSKVVYGESDVYSALNQAQIDVLKIMGRRPLTQ
jgi:ABC-type glycerol-3-phosphate transport system substrate-binding protein